MPPLQRAVPLTDRDDLSGRVPEQLDLDVARGHDLALEVDGPVPEGRRRLARPAGERRGQVVARGHAAHPPPPAAGSSLDQERVADRIGLAFQVQDDILDVESDTATLGKHQGADIARDKPTYPSLLGLHAAKDYALELRDLALQALLPFGTSAEPLRKLARFIVERRS